MTDFREEFSEIIAATANSCISVGQVLDFANRMRYSLVDVSEETYRSNVVEHALAVVNSRQYDDVVDWLIANGYPSHRKYSYTISFRSAEQIDIEDLINNYAADHDIVVHDLEIDEYKS